MFQVQKPVITSNEELIENGLSPLDGILPKDPKFGVLDGDMVSELLETSKSENNIVMNGVHLDTSKMNGDVTTGKRLLGEYVDNSPAKKQAVDGGQVIVTNGGHGNGSLNGAGIRQSGGQIVNQLPAGSQFVKNAQGQLFIKTSSPSGGVVLQPAGQHGGQPVIMQQPAGGQMVGSDNNGGNKIVFLQQSDGHQQMVRQQQTVVHRVSAPVAQVAAPDPDHLPQVDGADDGDPDNVPQVDGTTGEQSGTVQQQQPQPSVIQRQSPIVQQQQQPAAAASAQPTPNVTLTQSEPAPSPSPPPSVKIDTQKPFLCEWAGCMKAYKTPKEVENHAISVHCPLGSDDIPCMWARCDGMKRKRFSLMTHLQDRHCHPQVNIETEIVCLSISDIALKL